MTEEIFITFLGRPPRREDGYPKTRHLLRKYNSIAVAFSGWALRKYLWAYRTIVFGNESSIWVHLFEGDFSVDDTQANACLDLIEAAVTSHRSPTSLDELPPIYCRKRSSPK